MSPLAMSVKYKPAYTRRDLPVDSKRLAMDAFLMSGRVQAVVLQVARDMADDARDLAVAKGLVDRGEYRDSFEVRPGRPVWAGQPAFPRRTAVLENTAGHAAALEWGNSQTGEGHHVMGEIQAKWHSPKAVILP